MRQIGSSESEKEAYSVCNALKKQGVACSYDIEKDEKSKTIHYRIWVVNEEDVEAGLTVLNRYRENPDALEFQRAEPVFVNPDHIEELSEEEEVKTAPPLSGWKIKISLKPRRETRGVTLTQIILFVCIAIFMWNDFQESQIIRDKGVLPVELGLTPLQREMMFDEPAQMQAVVKVVSEYPMKDVREEKDLPEATRQAITTAEAIPYWKGFYQEIIIPTKDKESPPLFEKIRTGEVWRLFTPCLLHRDFLHILFNLAWLWVLGRQIEDRIGKLRLLALMVVVGVISNIAQYFMSGPYFIGLSGVVVGMVGFIWQRQRKAPWEGYPLNKPTILFIVIFVAVMALLEFFAFFMHLFTTFALSPNIANTAHIVGGLVGIGLGRLPFFQRKTQ